MRRAVRFSLRKAARACLCRGGRGMTVAEVLVVIIVLTAVAVTTLSAVGGGFIRLGARDRLILLCQDPAYYNSHVSQCSNP